MLALERTESPQNLSSCHDPNVLLVSVLLFKSFSLYIPPHLSTWERSLVLYAHPLNMTSILRDFIF